jgi:hypothetical protein
MDADTAFTHHPEIDARFLNEWVEFGMIQLNAYLAGHARFARYCEERDSRSSQHGGGDVHAAGFRRLESAVFRCGSDPVD